MFRMFFKGLGFCHPHIVQISLVKTEDNVPPPEFDAVVHEINTGINTNNGTNIDTTPGIIVNNELNEPVPQTDIYSQIWNSIDLGELIEQTTRNGIDTDVDISTAAGTDIGTSQDLIIREAPNIVHLRKIIQQGNENGIDTAIITNSTETNTTLGTDIGTIHDSIDWKTGDFWEVMQQGTENGTDTDISTASTKTGTIEVPQGTQSENLMDPWNIRPTIDYGIDTKTNTQITTDTTTSESSSFTDITPSIEPMFDLGQVIDYRTESTDIDNSSLDENEKVPENITTAADDFSSELLSIELTDTHNVDTGSKLVIKRNSENQSTTSMKLQSTPEFEDNPSLVG
jgi:hypothetical protein